MKNEISPDPDQVQVSSNGKRRGKLRLLTRDDLDGRTRAALIFDAIAEGIAVDLGGADQMTTIQRHLVEAFAGAALSVQDLNARLLLGDQVNLVEQSQAISSLVRLAAHIGMERQAKNIGGKMLGQRAQEDREEQRRLRALEREREREQQIEEATS